jgi:GcrA cell cycle regulator
MLSANWAPGHSDALRELLGRGLSFAEIARAINAKFGTDYTRNATLGRARRLKLLRPDRPKDWASPPRKAKPSPLVEARERHVPEAPRLGPVRERAAKLQLRCVGITPRHLSLLDLEPDDCRYPYGGDKDGEAITFCGHARREGSCYCTSHFHLTRKGGATSERAAVKVLLRLVEAA